MRKNIIGLAMVAVLALSGCATMSSKPRTFDQLGQFSTVPLNTQVFRVSFLAGSNISFATAEEITLVKAAQITVKKGFSYFKVMDDPSNLSAPPRQAVVYPAPMPYYGGYYRRGPYPYGNDPFYNMPQVVTIDPVQASYTIQCFKDKSKAPNDAFDAHTILQTLGQKYGLTPTGDVIQPQLATPTTSTTTEQQKK